MATLKIYSGSSWVTAIAKVWNGSAWVEKLKFYNGTAWQELYALLSVSPSTSNILYNTFGQQCHAFIEFRNNGFEYKNDAATTTTMGTSRGLWLDEGTTGEVWIQRILISGTFGTDPGSGRLAMTTSRKWGNTADSETKNVSVTFNFYDAASGGNLIGTTTISVNADSV